MDALISIREALHDPYGVLNNWDEDSVDPCSWAMITCSPDNLVICLWVFKFSSVFRFCLLHLMLEVLFHRT